MEGSAERDGRSPRANKIFEKVLFAYNFRLANRQIQFKIFESRTLSQSFALQNPAPSRREPFYFVQLFIFSFSTWLFRQSEKDEFSRPFFLYRKLR